MRIQYASDLHPIQRREFVYPKCEADILILAGDCLSKSEFDMLYIQKCLTMFHILIYVPGNHDFYTSGLTHYDIDSRLSDMFSDVQNAIYLDNSYCEINGVRFLGSCLWASTQDVETKYINDFKHIYETPGHLITEYDIDRLHSESCEFFDSNITKNSICITHFPPIRDGASHPDYEIHCHIFKDNLKNKKCLRKKKTFNYYTNDINCTSVKPNYWIYGHTHFSNSQIINGCAYLSNQLGYKGECTGYSNCALFEI